MTTTPNITVNIYNYGEPADVDIDPAAFARSVVAPAADPIPRIVPAFPEPMRDDTRRMLFAAYRDAFGEARDDVKDRMQRQTFTRTTLGLTYDDDPSWSRDGDLTDDQAYHMIRVLNVIADIL